MKPIEKPTVKVTEFFDQESGYHETQAHCAKCGKLTLFIKYITAREKDGSYYEADRIHWSSSCDCL